MANQALFVRCGVAAFLLTASPAALAQSAPVAVDSNAAPDAEAQNGQDIVVTGRAGAGERTKLDTSYAITTLNSLSLIHI